MKTEMKTETKFCPKCRRYVAMEVPECSNSGSPWRFFRCICRYGIYREDELPKTPGEFKPITYELYNDGKFVGYEKHSVIAGQIIISHKSSVVDIWFNAMGHELCYIEHDWKQVAK